MISTRSSQVWWVEPGGSGTSGIVIEAESVARGMPGMISAPMPRRSSARSRIGRPRKSESGLPSTPRPSSRWSMRPTKVSITSLEPRRKSPWSTIRSRSIVTPSLSRKRTSSGGASTVAARPTARSDSRLPRVRSPGSPGPRPTMRIMLLDRAPCEGIRGAGAVRLPAPRRPYLPLAAGEGAGAAEAAAEAGAPEAGAAPLAPGAGAAGGNASL